MTAVAIMAIFSCFFTLTVKLVEFVFIAVGKYYHPISLQCVLPEVLKRIIYDKIISFIFHLPQTNAQKFSIPKNWSSLTMVLSFFSIIFEAIKCGKICDVVYIDLRKAFDTVPHELLFILRNMGITGSLWKWFKG